MSFEELVFAPGWHEVEFEVHDFIFGLFVNVDRRYLGEKGGFFNRELRAGLFFEEEFLHVDESLLILVVDKWEDFITIALGKLVEALVSFVDVPE